MTFLLLLWSRFWSRSVETRAKDRLVWAYFKPLPITTSQYVVTAHRDWLFLSLWLPLSTLGDRRCAWQHRLGSRPRSSIIVTMFSNAAVTGQLRITESIIWMSKWYSIYFVRATYLLINLSWTSFRKINYCCQQQIHIFKLLILRTITGRKMVNFKLIDCYIFDHEFIIRFRIIQVFSRYSKHNQENCNGNVHFWNWNSGWHRFFEKTVKPFNL